MSQTLYIKNMVCDRCKMAVEQMVKQAGLHPTAVELGSITVYEDHIINDKRQQLASSLKALGFELLEDQRQQLMHQVKTAIIDLVHYSTSRPQLTLSAFLAERFHVDYSRLSKLFSECTGMTIERYYMLQRVEKVKELLKYDELTLTQIAQQMNYSSVAYLSSQFKNVTGMTPSKFKSLNTNTRIALDKI